MKAIEIQLTEEQIEELDRLYQTTGDVRLHVRSQIVLLAGEQHLKVPEIAGLVRKNEQTIRNWLQRYIAEGINGLQDRPRSGAPRKVSDAYREQVVEVVRQRPRSLGQSFSTWTLQRLVDYMAQETGGRVSPDTVRLILKDAEIVLSRPQLKVSSPDPEYQVKKRRLKTSENT